MADVSFPGLPLAKWNKTEGQNTQKSCSNTSGSYKSFTFRLMKIVCVVKQTWKSLMREPVDLFSPSNKKKERQKTCKKWFN